MNNTANIKDKPTKWSECYRDDLRGISLAETYGWSICFDYKDKQNGRTNIDNVPHDAVSFKRRDANNKVLKALWQTYKSVPDPHSPIIRGVQMRFNTVKAEWRCADLIDGKYANIRVYESIEAAFETECN
jgi:hypothetical protein